jgi:hypothetical protein
MARGWESKAVEAQQDEATRQRSKAAPLTAEEAALKARRESLMLARTKALTDLQHACAPAHRGMLEQAIAELDRQLAELEPGSR